MDIVYISDIIDVVLDACAYSCTKAMQITASTISRASTSQGGQGHGERPWPQTENRTPASSQGPGEQPRP